MKEAITMISSTDSEPIVVKQLPIIEQRLYAIKEQFEREVKSALELKCTEETRQAVKARRSELTKLYSELEARRKAVKSAILQPYEEFEKIYKTCVTDVYEPCNKQLAAKIDEVEKVLKNEKIKYAVAYFNEYSTSKEIDFVTFDDVGLRIGLVTSKKAIREAIKSFLDRVADDVAMINTQEYCAEIIVEYKKSFNASQAITAVINRHKAMAEEQRRIDERNEKIAEFAESAENTLRAVEDEPIAPPTVVEIPVEEPIVQEETEKRYLVEFKVYGTREKIKALKDFLEQGGYHYEQC